MVAQAASSCTWPSSWAGVAGGWPSPSATGRRPASGPCGRGTSRAWSTMHVPAVAAEDQRQLHRELQELKDEQTMHSNRIKGLLASQGLALEVVDGTLPEWLASARLWDGTALGADLQRRLVRETERW